MKLKRVNDSKAPTPKQMLNMAENLRKVYKKYSTVEVKARHYSVGDSELEYNIYIADFECPQHFETWPELMKLYKKLIKEGLECQK